MRKHRFGTLLVCALTLMVVLAAGAVEASRGKKNNQPTPAPTASPSPAPTPAPTASPTASPSPAPTASPSPSPSPSPTASPSPSPTASPSPSPTASPSPIPTSSAVCDGDCYPFTINLIPNGAQDARAVAVFQEAHQLLQNVLVGQRLVAQPVEMSLYYRISANDGLGGVLGSAINYQHLDVCTDTAFPCHYDVLPTLGEMVFDSADFFNNVEYSAWKDFWVEVTLHEMLHMLGVGSFWIDRFASSRQGYNTRVDCVADSSATYKYPGATREWNLLGGSGSPPVEYDHWNGEGTNCKHWDEAQMDTELMTSETDTILSPTTTATLERLSRVTLGAMEDLNYVVDWSQAESYSVPPSRRLAELEAHSHKSLESVHKSGPEYLAHLELYEESLHKQNERAKERKHLHEGLGRGVIEEVWYPDGYEAPLVDRSGHVISEEKKVAIHL